MKPTCSFRIRRLMLAGLGAAALSLPAPALAQPQPPAPGARPTPEEIERARRDYQETRQRDRDMRLRRGLDPNPPSELMREVLAEYGHFELARDRCDLVNMQNHVLGLNLLVTDAQEAVDELRAMNPVTAREIVRRDDRLQRAEADLARARAIAAQATRETVERCPPPRQPPPPPVETPVDPADRTDDVMQLPGRRQGPTYNVGFGGTWLNDGDLDLGLASGEFDVDIPLGDDLDESGLGNVRLGPRFRLTAELGAGIVDRRHEAGGFRDSNGLEWNAVALAGIVLPVGDQDVVGRNEGFGTGFSVFGQAGYGFARFNFELEGPGIAIDESDTSDFFAFRLGGEYFFDGRNGVRVAYTRWDDFNEDGISANLFSLYYIRRLGGRR